MTQWSPRSVAAATQLGQIEPVRVVRPTGGGGDGDHDGTELVQPLGRGTTHGTEPLDRDPRTAQVEIEQLRGRVCSLRDPEAGHAQLVVRQAAECARQPGRDAPVVQLVDEDRRVLLGQPHVQAEHVLATGPRWPRRGRTRAGSAPCPRRGGRRGCRPSPRRGTGRRPPTSRSWCGPGEPPPRPSASGSSGCHPCPDHARCCRSPARPACPTDGRRPARPSLGPTGRPARTGHSPRRSPRENGKCTSRIARVGRPDREADDDSLWRQRKDPLCSSRDQGRSGPVARGRSRAGPALVAGRGVRLRARVVVGPSGLAGLRRLDLVRDRARAGRRRAHDVAAVARHLRRLTQLPAPGPLRQGAHDARRDVRRPAARRRGSRRTRIRRGRAGRAGAVGPGAGRSVRGVRHPARPAAAAALDHLVRRLVRSGRGADDSRTACSDRGHRSSSRATVREACGWRSVSGTVGPPTESPNHQARDRAARSGGAGWRRPPADSTTPRKTRERRPASAGFSTWPSGWALPVLWSRCGTTSAARRRWASPTS